MISNVAFAASAVVLFVASAPAQATMLYVKSTGSNSLSCTDTLNPCQDIAGAVAKAQPNDSITCLDSGPKSVGNPGPTNPINITKSIDIDCHDVTEVYRDVAGVAITINIPVSASDPHRSVRIRGITIMGAQGSGRPVTRGIEIISAANVHIDNVVISDVAEQGIYDHRTGGQTKLFVTDSVIRNNAGVGIVAASQAVGATVLDSVRLLNNAYGLAAALGNNVVINRSTISGNTIAGVHADSGAQIEVTNSVLSHNTTHVVAFGAVRLRENDLKFSNTALQGSPVSFGGNRFAGNGSQGSALTIVPNAPADLVN